MRVGLIGSGVIFVLLLILGATSRAAECAYEIKVGCDHYPTKYAKRVCEEIDNSSADSMYRAGNAALTFSGWLRVSSAKSDQQKDRIVEGLDKRYLENSLHWFCSAYEKGSRSAGMSLARVLSDAKFPFSDRDYAVQIYKELNGAVGYDTTIMIAKVYEGFGDYNLMFSALMKAWESGDSLARSQASAMISYSYFRGVGVPENIVKGAAWHYVDGYIRGGEAVKLIEIESMPVGLRYKAQVLAEEIIQERFGGDVGDDAGR